MEDRFSSRALLAAAMYCLALLGLGAGCNSDVRAHPADNPQLTPSEEPADGLPSRPDSPNSSETGGGSPEGQSGETDWHIEEFDGFIEDLDTFELVPRGPFPGKEGVEKIDPPNNEQGQNSPGEYDGAPMQPPNDDEAATEPDGSEGEDAPSEDNWRAPIRGSGGDDPPDFIAPSDPKFV